MFKIHNILNLEAPISYSSNFPRDRVHRGLFYGCSYEKVISLLYYTHMPPQKNGERRPVLLPPPRKLLNKSFYRFLFSFIAVIAGVLLFILVLGIGDGAVQ